MKKNPTIAKYITRWYHGAEAISGQEHHLSDQTLFSMAMPGGLERAGRDNIEHLSLCPVCMDRLDELSVLLGNGQAEDPDDEEIVFAQGFLKTGDGGKPEKVRTTSECGRFILSLFPSNTGSHGTAVIEPVPEMKKKMEKIMVTVCDASGSVLIHGRITGGVLARKVEDIKAFDLRQWSVIVLIPKGDETQ